MASDPIELASTIQTASINRAPDPDLDINPSTAASTRVPLDTKPSDHDSLPSSPTFSPLPRPRPRRPELPPLPDMRFEQSYLKSIENAKTWQAVTWITFRDQMVVPLLSGSIWTLITIGWRHWNQGAKFAGQGIGARIRRWWWKVNNWNAPATGRNGTSRSGLGGTDLGWELKEGTRGAVSRGNPASEDVRKVGVW